MECAQTVRDKIMGRMLVKSKPVKPPKKEVKGVVFTSLGLSRPKESKPSLSLHRLTVTIHEEQGTCQESYYFSDDNDIRTKLARLKKKHGTNLAGYNISNVTVKGKIEVTPREFHQLLDWEVDELIEAQTV